jgi:hypothetical protein
MRAPWLSMLSTSLLAITLAAGCSPAEESSSASPPAGDQGAAEQDLTQATDAAIGGKLMGILKDVTFMSESDYPYVLLEGEVVTEKRLTTAIVRKKLAAAIKAKSSSNRDISLATSRSARVNVSTAIADGDAAVVPANKDDDNYLTAHHDKQLGIALKVMRSQLKSVTAFTFGTNASGDQDEIGPVVYVYVGISKTSGKLIAIMTEAVYT